jgi:hypothetical protein
MLKYQMQLPSLLMGRDGLRRTNGQCLRFQGALMVGHLRLLDPKYDYPLVCIPHRTLGYPKRPAREDGERIQS